MKTKKTRASKLAKRNMTDAEIKKAIKRDKAWMNHIDPDEEIEVPKGMLTDIFGGSSNDLDDENENVSEDSDVEEVETESDEEDDEQIVDIDDDDDDGDISSGKMIGALIGGVGGLVLGSILGVALLGDD